MCLNVCFNQPSRHTHTLITIEQYHELSYYERWAVSCAKILVEHGELARSERSMGGSDARE